MFYFLNKNLNLQLVVLTILAGWSAWSIFTTMTFLPDSGTMFLFQVLGKIWAWNSYVVRIGALLVVLTLTWGVIQHFHNHHFSEARTYLPGVFLLLLLNCGKFLSVFTPALLTVFFVALIMMLYTPNETGVKMKDRIFSFGLIIAIATLLDISAFGIVLFFVMMIAVNNVTSFKDIMILLIGISFPYIFAFSVAFMCNGTPVFTQSWRTLSLFAPVKTFTSLRVIDYAALGWFLLVILFFLIRDKRLLDNKLIVIRQAFTNVNLLAISMLLFMFLGIVPLPKALLYLLLPMSVYMSVAVSQKRYRFLVDFQIVALCVLLCF